MFFVIFKNIQLHPSLQINNHLESQIQGKDREEVSFITMVFNFKYVPVFKASKEAALRGNCPLDCLLEGADANVLSLFEKDKVQLRFCYHALQYLHEYPGTALRICKPRARSMYRT